LIDPSSSEALSKEYNLETGKYLLPFARRQDNDNIAGFEVIDNVVYKNVITVHLTWSSKPEKKGYPVLRESKDMFTWISEVVLPESKEWVNEEELSDIIEGQ